MGKRNVLHVSKLEDLKKWLVKDGWELLPLSNNPYEVLRASKAGKQNPLIIYSGKSSEHLSFADMDMPVIGAFIRDQKKPQTNADRIRSMTDEELAELLYSLQTEDLDGMFCKTEDKCEEMMDSGDEIPKSMCKQCLVKWLKSESEE